MPRSRTPLILLFVAACSSDADVLELPPAPKTCPPPTYLARASTGVDWHYRRTVLETNGPLDGITQLSVARVVVVDAESKLTTEGGTFEPIDWPIRRSLDLTCVDGVLVETEVAGGPYLDVDWSAGTALAVTTGVSFDPGAFVEERSVVAPARVEFVQRGSIDLDPGSCARFNGGLGMEVDCTVSGILRQSLRPADNLAFEPRADDGAFVFATDQGTVMRFAEAPVFYLPPAAPDVLVDAAQQVAADVATAVPGFEIRPNNCSEAALAAATIELPAGTLVERCAAYERLAPDAFTWQKPGGLASTIVWRTVGEPLGWGTLASRAFDPATGRIVAADVIVDATVLDRIAARARRNAADQNLRALVARAETRRDEVAATITEGARTLVEDAPERPIDAFFDTLAQTRTFTAFDLTDDVSFPVVVAGPDVGSTLPAEAAVYRRLETRIQALLVDGRADAAEIMGRGYSFLPRWSHPGYGATSALLAMSPDAHADVVVSGVARHRLLHATLEALGLADNPAGSWDGDTSVMDVVVAEQQHAAVELGAYDVAALANLYANGPRVDGLARCTIESAMNAPTLDCAIDDHGTTARASFAHAYGRWLGHYPITHIVDESLAYEPSPHDVLRPVIDAFWRASIAGQETAYRLENDATFPRSERAIDLTSTVLHAVNFAAEIVSMPLPGRHCPWPGADPPVYLSHVFFRQDCDPELPIDSADAIAQGQIEVRLGAGRDALVGPAVDEPWTRVGARIDKTTALWALALAFPSGLDPIVPRVALLDVEPSVAGIYERVIEATPHYVRTRNATALGSYWCEQSVGRRVLDVESGLGPAATPPGCTAFVHPTLSLGMVSSSVLFKQSVRRARPMLLFQVGVDDQAIDWASLPPGSFCYFVDLDGVEWRTIRADEPVACALLEHAEDAKADYEATGNEALRQVYEVFRGLVRSAHGLLSFVRAN